MIAFPPGPPPRIQLVAQDSLITRLYGVVGLSAEFNMAGNVVTGSVHVKRARLTDEEAQSVRIWGGQKLGVIPEQVQIIGG